MGSKAVRRPDSLHGAQAHAGGRGQGPARPVRRLAGRCRERQIDDPPDRLARQRSLAGRPRLVAQEAIHAFMHEPLLPTPDDRLRQAGAAHDLQCPAALGGRQDHASARRMLLRSVTVPNDPFKTDAILRGNFDNDACSHAKSMAQVTAFGNPPNASTRCK